MPRASYRRQEIRGTSLSHEGGAGMKKSDKRERRANVRRGSKDRNGAVTQRCLAGIFLPGGWLVLSSEFLTLINTSGN